MRTEEVIDRKNAAPPHRSRLPQWLTRQRAWLLAGMAAISAGVALNWDWLTAVSAAPILIAVLPCVAMCALGLCMRGGTGGSCSANAKSDGAPPAADTSRP